MGRVARQVTVFDSETGKLIKNSVNYGTPNGDGWVIMYRNSLMDLAFHAPLAAWKVFAVLASKQPFEGGVKIRRCIHKKSML